MIAVSRAARLERSKWVLTIVKLIGASLTIGWGLASTYVFARVLVDIELANFIVLIALANFTIGAELGISNILYDRLRRAHIGVDNDFAFAELAALLAVLFTAVAMATGGVGVAIALGVISTGLPALFVALFALAAVNMVVLLAKRSLAAIDRNLGFEAIDIARRLINLALMLAVLSGFDATLSIFAQLSVSLLAIGLCFGLNSSALGAPIKDWTKIAPGLRILKMRYLTKLGPAMALTIADIAAYNLPFIVIASLGDNLRPLLLYDFLYKLLRVLGTATRAVTEAQLPRLTRAVHTGDTRGLRIGLWETFGTGFVFAVVLAVLLLAAGPAAAALLYDGKLSLSARDAIAMALPLLVLPAAALSVHLNSSLARFRELVVANIPLLVAAVLAPVISMLAFADGDWGWGSLVLFASAYLVTAALHVRLLGRTARATTQISSS